MRPYPTYLLLSGVASFAGATAHTLNLVYWVQSAGLGPFQIVIAGTVLEAVYFLSQLPTGILADLRSRRLSVVLGYLLLGVGTLTQGAWATCAARAKVWPARSGPISSLAHASSAPSTSA